MDPAVCDDPVRSFDAFTEDLEALAAWLKQCGVTVVAMESTGVYWIPLYEILDRAGFEVHLVNLRAVKQVSGRKSDVLDCQWIWQLMSYGLWKGAFRPAEIGPDLNRFPDSEHFCSWLNLAPGTRISGGKPLPRRVINRVNRAGQALRMAAMNARHSNSFIGAAHRARLTRMDSGRAVKATAHQLARIIYATITNGDDYTATTIEQFEQERRERQLRNLKRRGHQLGMTLIEDRDAA